MLLEPVETFSALLALCAGYSPVPVNSPHKGQWRGALMFSLIYAWINDWVNNREAGDLRHQRGHYDVIVMVAMYVHHVASYDLSCGPFHEQWGRYRTKIPHLSPWSILKSKPLKHIINRTEIGFIYGANGFHSYKIRYCWGMHWPTFVNSIPVSVTITKEGTTYKYEHTSGHCYE